jgi:hypothetical protein
MPMFALMAAAALLGVAVAVAIYARNRPIP